MRSFVYIYLCLALFSGSLQAELYKWVDSKGQVHFSDQVPVEDARHERKILDKKSGRIVDTVERSKTVEELEEQERLDKIKAKQAEKEQLKKGRDRMLLLTYQNLDEVNAARDTRVSTIEDAIQIAIGTLKTQKGQLSELRESAADFERGSRSIPQRLLDKIGVANAKIIRTNNYIETRRREQELIRKDFAKFAKRYKELTE